MPQLEMKKMATEVAGRSVQGKQIAESTFQFQNDYNARFSVFSVFSDELDIS